MHFSFFVFVVFAIFAILIIVFSLKNKKISFERFALTLIMSCMSFMGYIVNEESKLEEINVLVCKDMGVVTDVVCAVESSNDKFNRRWSKCRVELNTGKRLNLTPEVLALKGDKLQYCSNSVEDFSYRNYYKVVDNK